MFEEMINGIQEETVKIILNIKFDENSQIEREQVAKPTMTSHGENAGAKKPVTHDKKVGRNQPCPCGSGKKYKQCCGK